MSKETVFDINLVKLDDIVVTNASIKNETNTIVLEKAKYAFECSYEIEIAVSIELKKLRLTFSCGIETLEKESKTKVDITANFQICFYFLVPNLEELIGKGPDFEIREDVGVTFSNLSYSTARGIIFTRCQGTPFRFFILPILPTTDIILMHSKAVEKKNTSV